MQEIDTQDSKHVYFPNIYDIEYQIIQSMKNKNKIQSSRATSATPTNSKCRNYSFSFKTQFQTPEDVKFPFKSSIATKDGIVIKRNSSPQPRLHKQSLDHQQQSFARMNNLGLEDIVKYLVLSGRTNNAEISSKIIHALNKTYIQSNSEFFELQIRPSTPQRILKQFRSSSVKKTVEDSDKSVKLFKQLDDHIPCFSFPMRKSQAVKRWSKKQHPNNQQPAIKSSVFDSPLFKNMTERQNSKNSFRGSKLSIKGFYVSSGMQSPLKSYDTGIQPLVICGKANIYL